MAPSPKGSSSHPPQHLAVQLVEIDSLAADPTNARQHPERHVRQLARSIEAFGFNCPILTDGEGHVVAGHGRLLAARALGWTQVPAIRLDHLTPDQVRAYRIADNRLTDCSSWDERLLAEQLKVLSEANLDFDLDAIGFDLPEIDLRIQGLQDLDEDCTPDPIPPLEAAAVSRLGDLWALGPHRIFCGSALEAESYAAILKGQAANLVFTDPPYNVPIAGHVTGNGSIHHPEFPMASGEMSAEGFIAFLSVALGHAKRSSSLGSLFYVCMDWRHVDELSAAGKANQLALKNLCVWDKGTGGMGSLYRSQHELVFVFKNGSEAHTNNVQLGRFGRNRTNIWRYPGVNSFARESDEGNLLALHPTVKPVALVADALLDASDRGAAVLDPFLGSGTTLIAAEKTRRVGFGIELDPRYVDVAIQRWQRLTGQAATLSATGQTFDAVALERVQAGEVSHGG